MLAPLHNFLSFFPPLPQLNQDIGKRICSKKGAQERNGTEREAKREKAWDESLWRRYLAVETPKNTSQEDLEWMASELFLVLITSGAEEEEEEEEEEEVKGGRVRCALPF